MTVILAKNNAGKSVLLKSIYHAFGATVTFDRIWRDLYVTVLVRFKIEGRFYQILRWGNSCGLFDGNNLLITSFRVEKTGRLPKELGEIFNFKMTWNNREGEAIIPPPAFMLMPYYIDQDISWVSNWKSFDKLSVLTNWRLAIIEYHVGLKPNEYYEKKTKQLQETKLYNERDKVLKLIRDTLKDIDSTLSKTDLNLDTEKFKEEIGQLIKECTTLQITQNKYKTIVNQLHSQKVAIEDQIKIVQTILGELRKDLTFAANELNDSIECPTCGAIYDNNFEERFAIARDEAECYELFNTLNEKKQKLQAEINNENSKLSKMSKEIFRIQKILNNKQEQVTLKDIIESQGKIQMKAIFNEKILALAEEQKKLLYELAQLNREVRAFDNKERRKEILDFYRETMKRNLRALNILDIETEYKRIDTKLDGLGQGSDITRAHLAYYFAIFDVIKKYGTSTFFPIIIDEPNQQGQDKENMPKILQFIKNNQPKESQIILGVENTREIDFDGEIITINNEPRQFLQKDEFSSVDLEITPLIDKLMALKQEDDPQLTLF